MDKHPSLLEINQSPAYREIIIDNACNGIRNTSEFRDCIDYVLDKKLHLFTDDFYKVSLYDNDDTILELILPTIRRIWSKIHNNPPPLLKDRKLLLFKLSFDIDDFLDYMVDILPKVENKLEAFVNLDRSVETFNLIVDNYVTLLFNLAYNDRNVESSIKTAERNIKLKKL